MSLIGPRPPLPSEVAAYDDLVMRRLRVKPGLTGAWQVSGRSDLCWEESIRLDLDYVDNWSVCTDLAILARTPLARAEPPRRLLTAGVTPARGLASPRARGAAGAPPRPGSR